VLTGNPVRKDLEMPLDKSVEAFDFFGLEPGKPVLFVTGGSLGARTVNNGVRKSLKSLMEAGVQVIWQTGRYYYETIKSDMNDHRDKHLYINDFISRMDYAYSIADLVVARAGACTISELCLQRKAAILIPSPNVAEDHQTKNALALSESDAAILLPDKDAEEQLGNKVLEVIKDKEKLASLSSHIEFFALHNSAERIVDEIIKVIKK